MPAPTSDEIKLEIWNFALLSLGDRPAATLTEQSKGALLCARIYPRVLSIVLSGFSWKFATETAVLTLTAAPATTTHRFALSYDLPADCLRARRVIASGFSWTEEGTLPFDVEGRKLWTDTEDAELIYTKSITDATLFDQLFIDTLSKYLAVHLAMPLTGNPQIQSNAFRMLQLTSPHAEATTANEGHRPSEVSGTILGSRS